MLIAADVRAYICREPVDMRKSIDTLSYLVEPLLAQKPASSNLFVFVGRDRTKVKCCWQLYKAGFVRDIYFRQDRAIIAEAIGLMPQGELWPSFHLPRSASSIGSIPLGPFVGWESLLAAGDG